MVMYYRLLFHQENKKSIKPSGHTDRRRIYYDIMMHNLPDPDLPNNSPNQLFVFFCFYFSNQFEKKNLFGYHPIAGAFAALREDKMIKESGSTQKNSRQKILLFIFLAFVVFFLTFCAAGTNKMVNSQNPEGKVAGFLDGLWHGFIALFTFVISLFSDKVGIYEVHNCGGWYDFGFIMGVMIFFGGGGGAGKKARCSKKEQELPKDNNTK